MRHHYDIKVWKNFLNSTEENAYSSRKLLINWTLIKLRIYLLKDTIKLVKKQASVEGTGLVYRRYKELLISKTENPTEN